MIDGRSLVSGPASRLVALLLLLPAGCSPSKAIVTGTVSYKGQPVPAGEIHFIGDDGQSRSSVITREGTYQVDDAPVGPVVVTVVATKLVNKTDGPLPSPTGTDVAAPTPKIVEVSLVPSKYNDKQTSKLRYTVARDRQTINVELQD
jgi:hypothetical protein